MNRTRFAVGVLLLLAWTVYIIADVYARYLYDNTIQSYWDLSVKASTLEQKSDYLNQFVAALDNAHLAGHDALFLQTPDNDYAQNYVALKSLQSRMEEIKAMNLKSFEYQQAISQITAQEQDEAGSLLGVFKGVWFKQYHYWLWNLWEVLFSVVPCLAGLIFLIWGITWDI